MSSFVKRQGSPRVNDSAKVKKFGDIILIDKLRTEYGENLWVATIDYTEHIIVNESDLKEIGYFE